MLELYKNFDDIEVGLDECARGVMFGRLYVGAVIMPKEKLDDNKFANIKDSKKLSRKKREELYDYIIKNCIEYSIAWVDEKEVNQEYSINLVATLRESYYDAVIIAVAHDEFVSMGSKNIRMLCQKRHLIYDLKSVLQKEESDFRL